MADVVFNDYMSISDVDILGDDAALVLDSLQGTSATPNSIVQALAKVRQADPAAVAVKEQLYARMGIQTAGIPRTHFTAATATQTVEMKVIRPFKPYQLIAPSSNARFFSLLSAKINGNDQLASSNPQPLQAFSEVSVRAKFRWETVNTSSPLVLQFICNDTSEERDLELIFLGAALMK